jgi:hypothetical protein
MEMTAEHGLHIKMRKALQDNVGIERAHRDRFT